MRHPRIIIAAAAVAVGGAGIGAAVAASGGMAAASNSKAGSATVTPVVGDTASGASATIHTVRATVNGKAETILVDAKGLPLYTYKPETATKSLVSGGLLAAWPALDSTSATISGANGKVSVVHDAHGDQLAYNGHLLYTFVSDSAGHVTGQGVSDFFVATPGLAKVGAGSSSSMTPPPATTSSGGYGY